MPWCSVIEYRVILHILWAGVTLRVIYRSSIHGIPYVDPEDACAVRLRNGASSLLFRLRNGASPLLLSGTRSLIIWIQTLVWAWSSGRTRLSFNPLLLIPCLWVGWRALAVGLAGASLFLCAWGGRATPSTP